MYSIMDSLQGNEIEYIKGYQNEEDNSLLLSIIEKENDIKNELKLETSINENSDKCPKQKKPIKAVLSTGPKTKNSSNKMENNDEDCMDELNEKYEELRNISDKGNEKEKKEENFGASLHKRKLGRKKKNSNEEGKHNKYSEDNIIRKIKVTVISFLKDFINLVIFTIYDGKIGKGVFKKELLKLNQRQIIISKYNREFLDKSLKDIFSEDISTKFNNYKLDHNKRIINNLLNEPDFNKRTKFENLFNLTFLECILHIRGENPCDHLKGLASLDDICKKFEDDKDYYDLFKYYIFNIEKIIRNKKRRNNKSL